MSCDLTAHQPLHRRRDPGFPRNPPHLDAIPSHRREPGGGHRLLNTVSVKFTHRNLLFLVLTIPDYKLRCQKLKHFLALPRHNRERFITHLDFKGPHDAFLPFISAITIIPRPLAAFSIGYPPALAFTRALKSFRCSVSPSANASG